jgi:hypothetical protein
VAAVQITVLRRALGKLKRGSHPCMHGLGLEASLGCGLARGRPGA